MSRRRDLAVTTSPQAEWWVPNEGVARVRAAAHRCRWLEATKEPLWVANGPTRPRYWYWWLAPLLGRGYQLEV
eukprot:scaffold170576_cov30-Tisochrysis_lutea.AAC.3